MSHEGQVLTRTMLLEAVWDCHFDPQTNVIDVQISRLRSKIDRGFSPPLIHTVRGVGYLLGLALSLSAPSVAMIGFGLKNSIATRLALGNGAMLAAMILVISTVFYFGTVGVLDRSIDGKIRADLDAVDHELWLAPGERAIA